MIDDSEKASGAAGALIARLAAGLMLFASALFALIAIWIGSLQTRGSGESFRYLIPWTDNSGLAPEILEVLIGCAVLTGLVGVAALATSRAAPRAAFVRLPGPRRPYFILLFGALVLGAALALRRLGH